PNHISLSSLPPFLIRNPSPKLPPSPLPGRPQGHARTIHDCIGESPVYCTGVPLRPPWGVVGTAVYIVPPEVSPIVPLRPPWGWVGGIAVSIVPPVGFIPQKGVIPYP